MANPASFVEHVTDLFSSLGDVAVRRMFGGHGLFFDGLMFGLLDDGELFLRTDEVCEQVFLSAGGKRWIYPSRKGPMETRYLQPPAVAMEDPEAMREWFALSLEAARRKHQAKPAKAAAKRTGKPRKPATKSAQPGKSSRKPFAKRRRRNDKPARLR